MTTNGKLVTGFLFAGLAALIWLAKAAPKYELFTQIWGCNEYCQCDHFYFDDVRRSGLSWEYWMGAPENVWVPESAIDKFVAQGQQCTLQ